MGMVTIKMFFFVFFYDAIKLDRRDATSLDAAPDRPFGCARPGWWVYGWGLVRLVLALNFEQQV